MSPSPWCHCLPTSETFLHSMNLQLLLPLLCQMFDTDLFELKNLLESFLEISQGKLFSTARMNLQFPPQLSSMPSPKLRATQKTGKLSTKFRFLKFSRQILKMTWETSPKLLSQQSIRELPGRLASLIHQTIPRSESMRRQRFFHYTLHHKALAFCASNSWSEEASRGSCSLLWS